MKDFEKFIDGFRNFRRFYFDAENDYYTSLNKGQHPKAIVIACSDSRADPALLMGCDPGDIFVVRNVANLVPHADDALRRDAVLAVLEYGVHHLKVEHIIVLGHSGCGGIQALLNPESLHDESFVANWVSMAAPALERMREDVRDESPADAENDYYTSLNKGQHPKAIVIACSDSRADPALLMGCDPGDIFVVRNVANLVPHADDALRRDAVLAVLEYGVHHLKVEHIIVLGHSGCGGIQALLNPESLHDESFVANWVSMAAPALERMREDVRDESPADRQRHCEEAAILVSIDNLLSYPWIQERVAAHKLSLHAWYFDMSQGSLLAYFPDSETFEPLVAHCRQCGALDAACGCHAHGVQA